jgi:hypothetical protein
MLLINIYPILNAQNTHWMMGNQIVDFTNTTDAIENSKPLPVPTENIPEDYPEWGYAGQIAQLHQNAQFDADGNLLFFIVDGWIYNKDGYIIADAARLYQPGSSEDLNGEIEVQANAADIIISPVPNQCNLFYLILAEVHSGNSPQLQAHYMILDTDGPNQFYPDHPEIRGRLLHTHDNASQNTLAEFPNFDQVIFDETNYNDRGILFYTGGSAGTQPMPLMKLHNIKNDDAKHLYLSYHNKVWRFIVREDKILLQSIYNYTCNGIEVEYNDDGGGDPTNIIQPVWSNVELPELNSAQDGEQDIPRLIGGDMQIHYVDNIGKNVMVFTEKIAGVVSDNITMIYLTTLKEDGSPDIYLGCIPYTNVEIFGLNFSPTGDFLYLNFEFANGQDGGLHCWELFDDHAQFINLPINQNNYFNNGFSKSRLASNVYDDLDALYTAGNVGFGTIVSLDQPGNIEYDEIDSSPDIDLNGFISWWVESNDPYKFRFFSKQNYSVSTKLNASLEPECCLPGLNETGLGNMSFTGDETWTYGDNPFGNTTEPVKVKGTFTFETGSKIDFKNMEFQFGPDAKIVIEPGARLIVDGATLTSACNVLWRGIFVVGNTNETQSYSKQGYLISKNNAVISNATFAVRNYGLTAGGSIDPNKSGGIIRATATNFINNKTDVRMRTFKKYYDNSSPKNDLSYFRNCDFITDKNVFEESDILHINFYDVNKVIIRGCTFSDSRLYMRSYEKSIGISSNNAAFKIGDYGSINSMFLNLQYAIKAWNYNEATITVENAEFNCYKGIYFNGIEHAEIIGNDFYIVKQKDHITTDDYAWPYGLYLDQGSDYKVESNFFKGQENIYPTPNFGLVVHNTHGLNTTIRYNNEFLNLTVGAEAIGQNKDFDNEEEGLQLLCNNAINNEFDFAVVKFSGDIINGIALNQGQAGGETTDPAGNLFSVGSNVEVNYKNQADHINYFHHDPDSEPRVKPSKQGSISLFPAFGTNYNPELSCIIPTDGGDGDDEVAVKLSKMNDASGTITQINTELGTLIDGGNTSQLENDVVLTTNTDAWNKYLQLMAEAGYLSEDVLAEVSKKETGFSKAMIRNILAANPQAAKSAEVQKNLDERINPLPDYMREQIDLGLTKISPKEYLEWMRAVEKRTYDRLLNEVLQTWMADTVVDHSTEIIDLLSNTGDIYNNYRLVDYYDSKGQFMLGDMLLDVINGFPLSNTAQEDYNNFNDFRNLTLQWKQNDIDLSMLDEAQISQLQNYATMRYPVGSRAMALLELNDALDYSEPLFVPEGGDKSFAGGKKRSVAAYDNLMVLFPNPSSEYFTVDYSLREAFNSGKLVIVDVNGKIIRQTEINHSRDQILISIDNWPSGNYTCILLADGKTMLSKKITIIK